MKGEVIEVLVDGGAALRVAFVERADRLRHVISLIEPHGRSVDLLESIEGTPDDAWPASPPLQSFSIETLPDGRGVAFLVGMAGGSHWSASVEAAPDAQRLVFDIACRHGTQPGWLGSSYRVLSDNGSRVTAEGEAVVKTRDEVVRAEPKPLVNQSGTTRWRYFVGFSKCSS